MGSGPAGEDVIEEVAHFVAGAGCRSAAFARAVPFGGVGHHPLLEPRGGWALRLPGPRRAMPTPP